MSIAAELAQLENEVDEYENDTMKTFLSNDLTSFLMYSKTINSNPSHELDPEQVYLETQHGVAQRDGSLCLRCIVLM